MQRDYKYRSIKQSNYTKFIARSENFGRRKRLRNIRIYFADCIYKNSCCPTTMKQVACLFLLVSIISNCLLISVEADDDRYAFDNKINDCLFNDWQERGTPILASKVDCNGDERFGLCYGFNKHALFAVCYNSGTLIPEFTGHVVNGDPKTAGRGDWEDEAGRFAPNPQSDIKQDYEPYRQKNIVPNFNTANQYFYSRGHLTPNNIFDTDDKRVLTMINTNVAPQWQLFNSQNWATLEKAVRSYSREMKRPVYVVTGTGGTLLDKYGDKLLLNKSVVAPGYYWKAVCEPVKRESVVFVAANPTGTSGTEKEIGCIKKIEQTRDKGIINCYSLDELRGRREAQDFNLPNFAAICNPSRRGKFLDNYLNGLK